MVWGTSTWQRRSASQPPTLSKPDLPPVSLPDLSSPDDSPAPHFADYAILNRLGQGGTGTVWRAIQLSAGREVAIKILSAGAFASDVARRMFQREVELTARLEHPNIARIYDSGLRQGFYFYVMAFVDGVTLDEYVNTHQPGQREILQLVLRICSALIHAHQRGIIHRDLKPSNILVSADGEPHVLDFGSARALIDLRKGVTLSIDGEVVGTIGFMSPEQVAGRHGSVDTRSDVYSIGVILYRLLTKHDPHRMDGSAVEVMRRCEIEEVTRPRLVAPALGSELEALLLKALAREPAQRYASVSDLAADVDRYLGGEPLKARPPTLAYIVRKRLWKHRVASLITLVVLSVGIGGSIAAFVRIARARQAAEDSAFIARKQRLIALENEQAAAAAKRGEEKARRNAELRLAESELARGDSMSEKGDWVAAKELYRKAQTSLRQFNQPTLAADLALVNAYFDSPPPLMRFALTKGTSGAGDEITATAITRSGERGAACRRNGRVHVYQLQTGRELLDLRGHRDAVVSAAFSSDGALLITGSADGTARIWDATTGEHLQTLLNETTVTAVAFSPDSKWCGTTGDRRLAALWHVADGRQVATLPHLASNVVAIAFSPDGRQCATGGIDRFVRLWSVPDGKPLAWMGHDDLVNALSFLPDSSGIVAGVKRAGDNDRDALTLRKIADGTPTHDFTLSHKRWEAKTVEVVQVSTNSGVTVAAEVDGSLRVCETASGAPLRRICGDGAGLHRVSFSSDARLALAADGADLVLYDVQGDGGAVRMTGHGGEIRSIHTFADQRLAISACEKGRVLCWDIGTGTVLSNLFAGHEMLPGVLSSDERLYLSPEHVADRGTTIRLWNFESGTVQWQFSSTRFLDTFALSPDNRLAVIGTGSSMDVWDLQTRQIVRNLPSYWTLQRSITLNHSDAGPAIAGVTSHGAASYFDVGTGLNFPGSSPVNQTGDVTGNPIFTRDGRVVVASSNEKIYVWHPLTGRRVHTLSGHSAEVSCVAMSPDDQWFVSASADHTVKAWDLQIGREIRTLTGHTRSVSAVTISKDGRKILSGSSDGTIRVYDLDRIEAYDRFASEVPAARERLQSDPNDANALLTLGRWYAFRGQWSWAVAMFEAARSHGADVPSLSFATAYRETRRKPNAIREFNAAIGGDEASLDYLRWCIRSVVK